MKNHPAPKSSILVFPPKNPNAEWRSDLSPDKKTKLMRSASNMARQYYLNRDHEALGMLTQGATITLRSRKYTYSWLVKGFTQSNTFEIARDDNPNWALAFKVNEKGFCLDSDPGKNEYPLMILEHSDACNRNELSTFNKEISDQYSLVFGVAGWDHRQFQWYWQTRPPREFAYELICSPIMNKLLENEEIILFTIDSYRKEEACYRVSLYRPFDIKTIDLCFTSGKITHISTLHYPENGNEPAFIQTGT